MTDSDVKLYTICQPCYTEVTKQTNKWENGWIDEWTKQTSEQINKQITWQVRDSAAAEDDWPSVTVHLYTNDDESFPVDDNNHQAARRMTVPSDDLQM